ncbi:hypothetical protein [Hansschlegelia sp. KR7-227]|jgi:hypothetical protein|uniref:hypothetical protein n=1 Tax=Hansschlegelia sp. KR7-227 TaxID=3400914 RepID=UPI003C0DACB8
MIEPMVARLVGCVVFAGLLGTLVVAIDEPRQRQRSDVVAAVEMQHRVQDSITRP